MNSSRERREFLEEPKLRLVDIAEDALQVEQSIDPEKLDQQIDAGVKAYRAKRGRAAGQSRVAHA